MHFSQVENSYDSQDKKKKKNCKEKQLYATNGTND